MARTSSPATHTGILMARMIPPVIDDAAPNSERRVFDKLQGSPNTDNWVVLHSLGLSNAYSGGYGEIDFVILIPDFGIVCVEVKGGGVSQLDGTWSTINAKGEQFQLKRSPFRQVQEAMWKLLSAIRRHFGDSSIEAQCPIGWIVVFPDVRCPPPTSEFVRAEVIDRDDMAADLRRRILGAPSIVNLAGKTRIFPPGRKTCDRMLSFLRPDFDRVVLPAERVRIGEGRIAALTEEQYASLDAIGDNPVCLVKGPAGTGKTLLAIERAKRLSHSGRDVLLTCYNRNLGTWLAEKTTGFGPGRVEAGSIHALLRKRILNSRYATEFECEEKSSSEDFYREKYFILGALAISETGERFHGIVIDEVQDISHNGLAMVIDEWTSGQSERGVLLFGDFERQALYQSEKNGIRHLQDAFPNVPVFKLRVNCRNTIRIAQQTTLMSGMTDSVVSHRQVEGEPVEIHFIKNKEAALERLNIVLNSLAASGFSTDDIAILGRLRKENTWLSGISSVGQWRIGELGQISRGQIPYSTIHGFKGLERPAVILVEPTQTAPQEIDALLYVGMSRARLRLFLLCDKDTQVILESNMASHVKSELESAK
jgi:hypothetical protein